MTSEGNAPRSHTLPSRLTVLMLALLVPVALLASGCREERNTAALVVNVQEREIEGDPRSFLLGFSDIPAELTDASYVSQFDFVASHGEVILLQRPPSWTSFLRGASVANSLRDEVIAAREAARARDLTMVVALDPFDPGNRARLYGLPATYEGRTLADPDLRAAFVAEAEFLARNMRPDYLVLGTEVNTTYERNPEGYFAFVEAYLEAYDVVKETSPLTQVLVTYQYEEFLGIVPDLPPHQPRWDLFEDFGDRLDLIGITSYPSFVYPTARRVPVEYYQQITQHTGKPVAFIGVGFSSAATRGGVNASTEPEQRRFLQRLLEDAFRMESPLLVWFAAHDLGFATTPPYDLLANIGLRSTAGAPKEAWGVWEAASKRPIDHEAAAELLSAIVAEEAAIITATPEPEVDPDEDEPDADDAD